MTMDNSKPTYCLCVDAVHLGCQTGCPSMSPFGDVMLRHMVRPNAHAV